MVNIDESIYDTRAYTSQVRKPVTRLLLRAPLVVLLSLLSLAGCGPSIPYYDYSKEPDPRKLEYIIGVSDVIRIDVYKHTEELGTTIAVRPDGTITMSLIGDIVAAGRTPGQLREEIVKRLKVYLQGEILVTVAVTDVNSYKFTVAGNVERGGSFTSKAYVSVADAIAMAGGPNRFATPSGTVIIRTDRQGTRKIPVDYGALRAGKRPEMNLVIVSGDTIYVP
jgi:polysaccharide export outer membrane protein